MSIATCRSEISDMWVLTSALGAAGWLALKFPGMFAMGAALKDQGCFLLPGRDSILLQQDQNTKAD